MVKLLRPVVRAERRWVKRGFLILLALGILGGLVLLVFKSDFFVIKKVNCRVEDKTSLADEKRWCEAAERWLLGERMFYLNQETAVAGLRQKFLPVGEVTFVSHYPQTVELIIKERRPIAKVSLPGGLPFLIDKEGVLYSQAKEGAAGLKTVTLEIGSDLSLGQQIDPMVVKIIELGEVPVSLVKLVGQGGIEAQSRDGVTILFSRQKDLSEQINTLQTLIKIYKIRGKALTKIDLRFDKPVVVY